MVAASVQCVLLAVAGTLLFLVWRRVDRRDHVCGLIAGAGLCIRSLVSQLLFWLSYLELAPRGLHVGGGIWFFAFDGYHYFRAAAAAARLGPSAIAATLGGDSSAAYVETLAWFVTLFGEAASAGALLNLFCYALLMLVIVEWRAAAKAPHALARFAAGAIAFYPAAVLWSSQPLKDPFVHLLLVSFLAAGHLWDRAWRGSTRSSAAAAAGVAVMFAALSVTTGTRWYLGFALLLAAAMFFAVVVLASRRRTALVVASLVAFVLLSRGFLLGGTRIPPVLVALLNLGGASVIDTGGELLVVAERARALSEYAAGATEIRVSGSPSVMKRWLAGSAAISVPHFMLQHQTFIRIGGGRGLFWFADADTLLFVWLCIGAAMLIRAERPRSWRTIPPFWLAAGTAVLIALPLLYAVANFGTLFRFRGMLWVPIAVAPLAAARPEAEETAHS
ncbi:MAG TPA: hypothetical protein VF824_21830 [Thermoanaerobaculia bacterium]|jgi:hypothetical protein